MDLLKTTLTDLNKINVIEYHPLKAGIDSTLKIKLLSFIDKYIRKKNYRICRAVSFNRDNRENGKDWPLYADTMIGLKRLNNLEECIIDTIHNNIHGDLIETGVWRGGATIFMRAVLKLFEVTDKTVWVADSFEGLPKPDENKYSTDKGDIHYLQDDLRISIEQVKDNFKKYHLLDDQVQFLKGWFKDTLPNAPFDQLSILRLDGDMYESTMDALVNLYPKLSIGGYIIIDDWGAVEACKKAVIDYRTQHRIQEEIQFIDWSGVYWKKIR